MMLPRATSSQRYSSNYPTLARMPALPAPLTHRDMDGEGRRVLLFRLFNLASPLISCNRNTERRHRCPDVLIGEET